MEKARQADLLPVPYFHVVFTLPAEHGAIAYHNKTVVYDLLFKASSETMLTIAADPKHLGAKIGIVAVLHTWGSAMAHHPHVHMIVPGGGFSFDGTRWIATKPDFLLPVLVLSQLFRRLMLDKIAAARADGKLEFHGTLGAMSRASSAIVINSGPRQRRRRRARKNRCICRRTWTAWPRTSSTSVSSPILGSMSSLST